jgi:hypothetical protein
MRNRFRDVIVASATVGTLAILGFGIKVISGQQAQRGQPQTAAYRAPRLDGKPNLNGIWQALNEANWDLLTHGAGPSAFPELNGAIGAVPPGLGVVEGNEIPYRPEALAKKRDNFAKRLNPAVFESHDRYGGDPEARCYMPGLPRATYMPYPFQIIQSNKDIMIAYEFANATRVIFMNSNEKSPADAWMGWSRGHWEGETLVVDVTDFTDMTWFDRAGDYHSDRLHVVERYTATSPYHLQYEATIEDPQVFTRPWKISMPLYRRMEKNARLLEFKCVEFAEPLIFHSLVRTK